jgi:hypothetical protein
VSSTSSTEAPGTNIGGFEIRRTIGRGSAGVVYEATQLGLERPVALRVMPLGAVNEEHVRGLRWPEHPNVVSLYASGVSDHGAFMAMRLMSGSLAERSRLERLDPRRAQAVLERVSAALDAAHAAGVVHGMLSARQVLFDRDGNALLSDFGFAPPGASIETDDAAFAELERLVLGMAARRSRRRPLVPGLMMAMVLAAVVVAVAAQPGRRPAVVPAVLPGARTLGSALAADRVSTLGCDGHPQSAQSPPCTIVQTALPGRAVSARGDGAIRRWTVRGAHGELALEVVRRHGSRFIEAARSQYERVGDPGVHVFRTDLPVRAGDRVGLLLGPGGGVGLRVGASTATTARWLAPLGVIPRSADQGPHTGLDRELCLRVEYLPGARAVMPGLLTGPAAAEAPAGRRLAERPVELPDGAAATIGVVRLPRAIAVDLVQSGARSARVPVAGADPGGRLVGLTVFGGRTPQLDWRNPDGTVVHHDYSVGARFVAPLDRPPV